MPIDTTSLLERLEKLELELDKLKHDYMTELSCARMAADYFRGIRKDFPETPRLTAEQIKESIAQIEIKATGWREMISNRIDANCRREFEASIRPVTKTYAPYDDRHD